jgi:hypothetical protein
MSARLSFSLRIDERHAIPLTITQRSHKEPISDSFFQEILSALHNVLAKHLLVSRRERIVEVDTKGLDVTSKRLVETSKEGRFLYYFKPATGQEVVTFSVCPSLVFALLSY